MLEFYNTTIETLSIHRVGNKHQEESYMASVIPTVATDELAALLLDYFCLPFLKATETYHFIHEIDIKYNVMKGLASKIFEDTTQSHQISIDILKHLFVQSENPQIKSGDLFVAFLKGVFYMGEEVEALGIFKSENKDTFIRLTENGNRIMADETHGINPKKADKSCLIINREESDGYRIIIFDSSKNDTEYWNQNFLNVDYIKDHNYETKNCINLCKDFSEEIIKEKAGKKEQINFLNRSIKYFEENETAALNDFKEALFADDETKATFDTYKKRYERLNDIEFSDSFDISVPVLKKQKRAIKNFIKLDTNIQIKMDFKNAESNENFIEKGYDDEKSMYFYKVFFNKEID